MDPVAVGERSAGPSPVSAALYLTELREAEARLREAQALRIMESVTQADRDKAKANNNSLADGSYPINNVKQLKAAATLAASKHGNWKAALALIRRRAKELGVSLSSLPGFKPATAGT